MVLSNRGSGLEVLETVHALPAYPLLAMPDERHRARRLQQVSLIV